MKDNPTKIIFVRHGVTEQTGKVLYGRVKGLDLSSEGVLQAKKTGDYLSSLKIDKVFSSPLERAFQTAQEIASHHNKEIEVLENLTDTDTGVFTGKTLIEAYKEKDWEIITSRPSQYTFEGGESFTNVYDRMNESINMIAGNNIGKNIVIVAHRDPIILLMAHYLGMHMDNFQRIPCAPASISIVNFVGSIAHVKGVGILPESRIEE